MPSETTHVIKKADVAASRAMSPDPSLLQGSLRIPRDRVEMQSDDQDPQPVAARQRRVRGENARLTGEPFEISTREIERRAHAARLNTSEGDEEPGAEEIEARWERRLEEEVASARAEGVAEGRESVRAETEEALREATSRLANDLDAIQHAWEGHLKNSQIRLVQLAFRVAQIVLDAPLPPNVRRISEEAVTEAIERMVDGAPIEVALHPVSYLQLQESGLEEQLRAVHTRLRWRSDPSLQENEWIVQSDRSAIRRLEAELLDDLQRELSVRDVPADEGPRSTADGPWRGDEPDPGQDGGHQSTDGAENG